MPARAPTPVAAALLTSAPGTADVSRTLSASSLLSCALRRRTFARVTDRLSSIVWMTWPSVGGEDAGEVVRLPLPMSVLPLLLLAVVPLLLLRSYKEP